MNVTQSSTTRRPRIAFAIGCPAGVAPELTARMLADREVTSAAQIIAIGDRLISRRSKCLNARGSRPITHLIPASRAAIKKINFSVHKRHVMNFKLRGKGMHCHSVLAI